MRAPRPRASAGWKRTGSRRWPRWRRRARRASSRRRAPNIGGVAVTGPSVTPQLQLSWLLLDFGRRKNAVGGSELAGDHRQSQLQPEASGDRLCRLAKLLRARREPRAARRCARDARAGQRRRAARWRRGSSRAWPRGPNSFSPSRTGRGPPSRSRRRRDSSRTRARRWPRVSASRRRCRSRSRIFPTSRCPPGCRRASEQVIDRALSRRPDLGARLATLRAREAEVRRARAEFMPRLKLSSSVGGDVGRYTFGGSPHDQLRPAGIHGLPQPRLDDLRRLRAREPACARPAPSAARRKPSWRRTSSASSARSGRRTPT